MVVIDVDGVNPRSRKKAETELKELKPKTIINRVNSLKLLQKRGANLLNPESVFHTINNAKKFSYKNRTVTEEGWSYGAKNNAAQAYKSFCQICKIEIFRVCEL